MDRRSFVSGSLSAFAATRHWAAVPILTGAAPVSNVGSNHHVGVGNQRNPLLFHRFGVNYTPSRNWWFCWNDWQVGPIQRDLDAIAALGADHLRILLIWPYFQPNASWVSPAHLDRLNELLMLMAERKLDALVTVFNGQLSGSYFLPPFMSQASELTSAFYTDPAVWNGQELFVRALSSSMRSHENVIGFDLGNELNTCWSTQPDLGDAWMAKMFDLMDSVYPHHIHVNGVDHQPWFRSTTFSPRALARRRFPVIHTYPFWAKALRFGGPMDPPSTKLMAAMAALVRSYAGDSAKPIWAEEFNTCIESLPEKGQAAWLESAAGAGIDEGISWFTYWDSHDVNPKLKMNTLEYTLGLLTNDGKVKEQGRVFKELASAYRNKPVVFPQKAPPAPPAVLNEEASWLWMLDWMGWKPKN